MQSLTGEGRVPSQPFIWSLDDLRSELRRFEQELRAANLREFTVRTYVDRTGIFLRWLGGEYEPRGPQR